MYNLQNDQGNINSSECTFIKLAKTKQVFVSQCCWRCGESGTHKYCQQKSNLGGEFWRIIEQLIKILSLLKCFHNTFYNAIIVMN